MTTIPEYLTVIAMAHQAPETREPIVVRSTGPSLRERITTRFSRRAAAGLGAAAPGRALPELRDYPYRAGC